MYVPVAVEFFNEVADFESHLFKVSFVRLKVIFIRFSIQTELACFRVADHKSNATLEDFV